MLIPLRWTVAAFATCLLGAGLGFLLAMPGVLERQGQSVGAVTLYDAQVEFPESLSSLDEPVSHLASDAVGNLWFATFSPGNAQLHEYNIGADWLQSFPLPYDIGTGAASGIAIDDDGAVLVGYGYTIVQFDPDTRKQSYVGLSEAGNLVKTTGGFEGTWITSIAIGPAGQVFAGRMNSAVLTEVDVGKGTVVGHPLPDDFGPVFAIDVSEGSLIITNWVGLGFEHRSLRYDLTSGATSSIQANVTDVAATKDASVYGVSLNGGIVQLKDDTAVIAGPSEMQRHVGGTEVIAYDDVSNSLWFTGDEQSAIYEWRLSQGDIREYKLPEETIPGGLTRCIGVPSECPDQVLKTQVGALEPDGKGNLFFADQTRNRIGVLRPD